MQNSPQFPQGLQMEQIRRLMDTPQGQAVLSRLQTSHPQELQAAVVQAQAGNFQQVQATLSQFLNSPEGKELMKQLRG